MRINRVTAMSLVSPHFGTHYSWYRYLHLVVNVTGSQSDDLLHKHPRNLHAYLTGFFSEQQETVYNISVCASRRLTQRLCT